MPRGGRAVHNAVVDRDQPGRGLVVPENACAPAAFDTPSPSALPPFGSHAHLPSRSVEYGVVAANVFADLGLAQLTLWSSTYELTSNRRS